MQGNEIDFVGQVLGLGLPGVLFIFVVILWRSYEERVKEHIEDLQRIAAMRQQQEQIGEIVDKWKKADGGVGD